MTGLCHDYTSIISMILSSIYSKKKELRIYYLKYSWRLNLTDVNVANKYMVTFGFKIFKRFKTKSKSHIRQIKSSFLNPVCLIVDSSTWTLLSWNTQRPRKNSTFDISRQFPIQEWPPGGMEAGHSLNQKKHLCMMIEFNWQGSKIE